MIDAKIVRGLMDRLEALDWYPKTNQAAIDDIRCALNFSHSEFIATSVVDDWIAGSREAPKPADLRNMIRSENEKRGDIMREQQEKAEARRPFSGCRTCQGFGYHGGFIGTNHDGPWLLCHCKAGNEAAQALVDEANDARGKLILRFGLKSPRQIIQQRVEEYHGEF